MANALNVKIGGDIAGLEKALNNASAKIQQAGKRMTSVGKSLTMSITAPLTALGFASLKTAADFETLQQSMNILNGSVEEGARNFERLKRFSAGTPFQLSDLAKAQNMLQGFGQSADDAFDSLSMIGDIAAVTGGSIEGIGIAFGQASAEGMLMTRDIRQLVNQGVPALQLLADTMGVGKDEIFDLASQGEISFEILQQAFRDATSEGGMFANGMQQQSQTLNGLFSTLKDNISIAMAEIGQSIADALNLREVVPAAIARIKGLTNWFTSLSRDARKSIINVVRVIALIGPALVAVGVTVTALGATIAMLTSPVALVVGAIAGIATAVIYVGQNWDALIERVSDISWWRNAIINMIQFFNDQFLFRIFDGFNQILQFFGGAGFANPFSVISEGLESLKTETKEYEHQFGSLKNAFLDTIKEFTGIDLSNMFAPIGQATTEVEKYAGAVEKSNRRVTESYRETVERIGQSYLKIQKGTKETKEEMINMGEALQSQVTGAIQSFATTLGDAFTGDAGASGFFNNILLVVADFGQNLGKALVAAGVAALAFKQLLLNPIAAIGAGAALIATSQIVKNLLTKGPAESVNDALITSEGKVVKFHPDDDILAMKDFSKLNTGGGIGVDTLMKALNGLNWRIKGEDIFVSSNRGDQSYGR